MQLKTYEETLNETNMDKLKDYIAMLENKIYELQRELDVYRNDEDE